MMDDSKFQSLILNNVLQNINKNDGGVLQILDGFFIQYVKDRLNIIDRCFNEITELQQSYNVFFREEDTYGKKDVISGIHLLKNFIDFETAHDWVIANGKNVIDLEEKYRNKPIVITIVPYNDYYDRKPCKYCYKGCGNCNIYDPCDRTDIHFISLNKHYTYAFSKKGYKMLVKEHTFNIVFKNQCDIVPWWIYYFKYTKNSYNVFCMSIHHGIKKKDLINIQNTLNYKDLGLVNQQLQDLKSLKTDPHFYRNKCVNNNDNYVYVG